MTDETTCPNCGQPEVEIIHQIDPEYGFLDELSQCGSCGEKFYTGEQSLANSRAYTIAVAEQRGLPSGETIKRIRLALGMKQDEFEAALGVGKKTVSRWENGTVPPSSTAAGMLWMAEHRPDAFLEYASRNTPEIRQPDLGGATVISINRKTSSAPITAPHGEKPEKMSNPTGTGVISTTGDA
jgi:putative zinc finger/helix-turn-helix YgiT family protein